MSGATPLQAVRAATRAAHARLEARLDLARLLSGPGSYRRLLAGMLGLHEPLEAALAAVPWWPALGVDPGERRRAHLIARDLAALGCPPAAVAALPRLPAPPPLGSPGRAMGCMYVLEGATLGAQTACRMLADPALPRTFLAGYGPRSGAMWAAFRRALDGAPVDPADAADAARATFAAAEAWLGTCGLLRGAETPVRG